MSVELKGCPFCGCDTPFVGTTLDSGCYVFCGRDECFGGYAYAETEADAIAGWNTRALSPSHSDGLVEVNRDWLETEIRLAMQQQMSLGNAIERAHVAEHRAGRILAAARGVRLADVTSIDLAAPSVVKTHPFSKGAVL